MQQHPSGQEDLVLTRPLHFAVLSWFPSSWNCQTPINLRGLDAWQPQASVLWDVTWFGDVGHLLAAGFRSPVLEGCLGCDAASSGHPGWRPHSSAVSCCDGVCLDPWPGLCPPAVSPFISDE